MNFREVYWPVARRLGDNSEAGVRIAKEYVNRTLREIANRAVWPSLCDEKQFKFSTEFTTGTVSVTKGSATVAGVATAWTKDQWLSTFTVGTTNIRYLVKSIDSATSLTLDTPYTDADAATQTYRLIPDTYSLERDTMGIIKMNVPENSRIINPGDMSRYYDVRYYIESAQNPSSYFHIGNTLWPYYNTGSVAATNGSTAVTGTGTAFDTTMVNRMIRFSADQPSRLYRITAVGGVTALTIDPSYKGTSGDNITYEIDPAGIPLVRIWPRPSTAYHVYYYRRRKPKELFEDDEIISDFSDEFHDVVVIGATYLALKERGDEPQSIMLEKTDFEMLLKKVINKNAITDPNIIRQVRSWGLTSLKSSLPGDYPYTRRSNWGF
jgi:hypothetical protein